MTEYVGGVGESPIQQTYSAFVTLKPKLRMSCYNQLKIFHDSKHIWNELHNLPVCFNGFDVPSIFSIERLNQHFARISSNPLATPVNGFLRGLKREVKWFPLFSLYFKLVSQRYLLGYLWE